MTITRNIKIVFCLLMFPFCCAMAQEEYTWEMGGVIGGSFYMGDANNGLSGVHHAVRHRQADKPH